MPVEKRNCIRLVGNPVQTGKRRDLVARFEKISRQPNNKTNQEQKKHKITSVHTTQKTRRKQTNKRATDNTQCRHKNGANLQNSLGFLVLLAMSKVLLAMSNEDPLVLQKSAPLDTSNVLERVEFRKHCFLVVPQS